MGVVTIVTGNYRFGIILLLVGGGALLLRVNEE